MFILSHLYLIQFFRFHYFQFFYRMPIFLISLQPNIQLQRNKLRLILWSYGNKWQICSYTNIPSFMFDPEYETTTVVVVLGEMAISNFTPPKKKKTPNHCCCCGGCFLDNPRLHIVTETL